MAASTVSSNFALAVSTTSSTPSLRLYFLPGSTLPFASNKPFPVLDMIKPLHQFIRQFQSPWILPYLPRSLLPLSYQWHSGLYISARQSLVSAGPSTWPLSPFWNSQPPSLSLPLASEARQPERVWL